MKVTMRAKDFINFHGELTPFSSKKKFPLLIFLFSFLKLPQNTDMKRNTTAPSTNRKSISHSINVIKGMVDGLMPLKDSQKQRWISMAKH